MKYKEVLEELYSIDSLHFKLGLKNIKLLLDKLGNPEKELRCIHVAGTNGKGSVCSIIHSVLADAGYKIGLYTSPHLKKFNERIRINDEFIGDKEIVKYYLKVKRHITNQSFFEITTAMMFLYFKDKKVDYAVLETGLGGRLDATNVVVPLISVITSISKEHANILGNSLRKIANEKAAIIKKKVPVVTGAKGVAFNIIKKISDENKSELIKIDEKNIDKKFDEKNNTWRFDLGPYKNLRLENLKGSFQVKNAALAISALYVLNKNNKIKISEKNLKNGLRKAKWKARFEFIDKNLIFDCAHNPEAFKLITDELRYLEYDKLIMVLGFSDGKNIKEISNIIGNKAQIILTKADNPRAVSPDKIKKYFRNPVIIESSKEALAYAKKIARKKDLVLVAGSIYMVGEVV